MFKLRGIFTILLLSILVIQISDAGYTSEETDEKSKSLYSAVTSILGSTESSKHHHKQTYDSPPCASGRCASAGAPNGGGYGPSRYVASGSPCNSPTGCPSSPQSSPYGNVLVNANNVVPAGVDSASGSIQPVNTNWGHNIHPQAPSSYGSYGHLPYTYPGYGSGPPMTHQAPSPHVYGTTGSYVPQTAPYEATPAAYKQPDAAASYGHWNNHPSHNSYQGPRGYSVLDHSLKTNSEYTEVGSHTGPLQQAANGYGYGSGYGGYNGLYNRPNF